MLWMLLLPETPHASESQNLNIFMPIVQKEEIRLVGILARYDSYPLLASQVRAHFAALGNGAVFPEPKEGEAQDIGVGVG